MAVYLGTSGYVYPDWQGRFYPKDLPQEARLEYYSQHFNAVEINLTFYRLPVSPVFRHWQTRTPVDFRFVLKGSRPITHTHHLRDCHDLLAEFFERASELGEKLACVLWQLPPKLAHDVELLEEFLEEMERVQVVYGKFRQAIEFRDISWFDEPVYAILKQFNVAVVMANWPFETRIQNIEDRIQNKSHIPKETTGEKKGIRPSIDVPFTADFLYFRFHGPATAETSPYTKGDLKLIARQIKPYSTNRDLYAFFNNNAKAYAVKNARQFRRLFTV